MSSKRRRTPYAPAEGLSRTGSAVSDDSRERRSPRLSAILRSYRWAVGAILLVSIAALGAGLKYLEEDARQQNMLDAKDRGLMSRINPFVQAPTPAPTPQLSKEYIYAGQRLLAVEDAGASAAPPADLAVWRPSTGTWWVINSTGNYFASQWGANGDIPVQGDYNGDGKTDFSLFRPSNGTWYIIHSNDNSTVGFQFGQSGDVPIATDFDGDGRTDAASFRKGSPSTGLVTWYILQSSTQTALIQEFGLSTDIPAAADYDGDGRADVGVWRESDKTFYSINSSNGILQISPMGAGSVGSTVVSADYDGDGRADHAVYNAASATWFIRSSSSDSVASIQWGAGGNIAVPNDYDGDGKADLAVWNNAASAVWSIRKSSNGQTRTETWGTTGDIPVPAFYSR